MISVILYGRNDSYGYNLHKRGAISFNCIAEVLTHPDDEIIFVDTNTPDDVPTFPEAIRDTLTPRAKKLLRVIRVRPAAYERHKNGTRMKVLEPLCRNVGIRRCNPRNRWVLNSNTDMVFVPVKPGQSLSETVADLPDGLYELPRFEMPEMLWESVDRANPQSIIDQFKLWGRRLHLNEMVLGNPENVFDGPGDFQLAPRKQLFAIHGMNEQMVLGWHVDSNLCRRLYLLNDGTNSLLERYHAYHCDHTRVNTMMHTVEGGTVNDSQKYVNDVVTPYLPEQAATWGMPHEAVEEIRLTEEHCNRYCKVLEQLLPGLNKPMLESALHWGSFNHGLLYDNQHVLPYITDHLSQIPPTADVGYIGANPGLLKLVAAFRKRFGHTGRLIYDPVTMEAGGGLDLASLPEQCVASEVDGLFDKAFFICVDLWMGNFETVKNSEGYAIPKPSPLAGAFAALLLQRFLDFARREKARYDGNPNQARKFLFLGSQNTWFDQATTQLISIILTPYSSYLRHGVVRKDAFTKPFQSVLGHYLVVGAYRADRVAWVEREIGHPALPFEFDAAEVHAGVLCQGILAPQILESVRAKMMNWDVGRSVLNLHALMADTDGRLVEAERMRAILSAPVPQLAPAAPHTDGINCASATVGTAPRRLPVIGIDVRTLCYPDSSTQRIGQYTQYHLPSLVRSRSNWQFALYADSTAPIPTLEKLLTLPNVQLRQFADYQPGDVDLFHIPDPLCFRPDHDSPVGKMPGVKTTVMFYDLAGLRLHLARYKLSQRFQYIERLEQILQSGCRLLTLSEFTRRDFIQATGCVPGRLTAIQAGLSQTESPPEITPVVIRQVRAKYGIDRRFLLHVGALDHHKNFESVVNVLAQLKDHDLQLVVVGERERSLEEIADHVARVGLTQIIFTGSIAQGELEVLYREAIALVSLSFYEGFGFPVLEAMAHGCPVITSALTALAEVAGDGALVYPPRDIQAISSGIHELLRSPASRRKLVEKGRARAAQFSWEHTARRTIAVWEEMLGCTPASDVSPAVSTLAEPVITPLNPALPAVALPTQTPIGRNAGQPARSELPGPLVSAIVSTYKAERFIRGCLEDLERQTLAGQLEIIVVDTASPQNERAVVEEFQKRYSNIVYIRTEERETVYGAWNRGIKAARGKYVTNANTDDRHRPDAFEVLVRTLEQNPSIALVYADCLITRTENEIFETAHPVNTFRWLDFNPADLLLKGCFVGPQPMWRREVHNEYGYFDASFVSAGDYEFWLRLAQTRKFLHVTETLGLYLESPASVEHSNRSVAEKEALEARRRYSAALLQDAAPAKAVDHHPSSPAPSTKDQLHLKEQPRKAAPITLPRCALIGHLAQGRTLLGNKNYRAAWEFSMRAIQARPYHPDAYLLLAEIALAAGDSASARRCGQRARELAPDWKPAKRFLKSNFRGNAKVEWLVLPESLAPRLSVCLIVKDEEKFLGQCLASVHGLADQIVIVDTGSSDRSVAIANEHGAEVYDFAWCDDFSAARNAALEHATGDWVLMLDADEELPPENHAALRKLLATPAVMAWRLPIIDVGREDEGCCYVPRLFRNAPALFYVGRVHEQVFTSIEVRREEWGLDNRLGDAKLRHHGYLPEVVKDRNKIERNLRLLEKAIVELPDEPHLLMNHGLELMRSGQLETGLEQYRKAFALMSAQVPSLVVPESREMLLTQYSTQLIVQRRFDEIIRVLTSPLARAGGLTASLHFALGLAHLELKQPREAADQMRQCLIKRDRPSLATINPEIHKAGPHHCLGLGLAQLGETNAAAEEFCLAIKDDPQSRPARFDYARLLAFLDKPTDALNLLFELANQKPDDLAVWLQGGQIVLSRPEFLEVALDWTAEANRHHPQDQAILRQRAEALTLGNRCEEALPLWRQLRPESDPAMAAVLVLCETAANDDQFSPPSHLEAQISREFLKWYQRLIQYNSQASVEAINARIDSLQSRLPSVAKVLQEAFAQAGVAVVA